MGWHMTGGRPQDGPSKNNKDGKEGDLDPEVVEALTAAQAHARRRGKALAEGLLKGVAMAVGKEFAEKVLDSLFGG